MRKDAVCVRAWVCNQYCPRRFVVVTPVTLLVSAAAAAAATPFAYSVCLVSAPGVVALFEQHTEFPHSTPEATHATSLNANPISVTAGGGATASEMLPPPEGGGNESAVNKPTLTARAFHMSSARDRRPSETEHIETKAGPYGQGCLCFSFK